MRSLITFWTRVFFSNHQTKKLRRLVETYQHSLLVDSQYFCIFTKYLLVLLKPRTVSPFIANVRYRKQAKPGFVYRPFRRPVPPIPDEMYGIGVTYVYVNMYPTPDPTIPDNMFGMGINAINTITNYYYYC